jgi:hypothetical protein
MSAFNPEISARAIIPKDLLGQASSLHLAIHINSEFVEASLSEAAGGEFHWSGIFPLETDHKNIREALAFVSERNWGERVFRKCTVSFETPEVCLVPAAFFKEEKASELLSFQCEMSSPAAEFIEFPELDAVMIYGLPAWSADICRKFPNARFFPLAALALRHAQSFAGSGPDVLGIYACAHQLSLIVFRNRKVHLINHFHVEGDEDILYHATNAAMRLGIDFENAHIHVASTSGSESLCNLLKHYNRRTTRMFTGETSDQISYLSILHSLCA